MDNKDQEIQIIPPEPNELVPQPEGSENLVSDEEVVGVYDEILGNLREDRTKVENLVDKFADMVINDGDGSTSSKETLVGLLKIQTDLADKKAKIAELMTRIKLKEKNTFPLYLAQTQNSSVKVSSVKSTRRLLIESVNKAKKNKKDINNEE